MLVLSIIELKNAWWNIENSFWSSSQLLHASFPKNNGTVFDCYTFFCLWTCDKAPPIF